MCTVSMIFDDWNKRNPWQERIPVEFYPIGPPNLPTAEEINQLMGVKPLPVSREEFDALKKELAELRQLLLAAKKYDAATGQPDCETEEKAALLKRLAQLVGVDMSDVFNQARPPAE